MLQGEKMKQNVENLKENWEDTSEYKLGFSYDEAFKLRKYFKQVLTNAADEEGVISDYSVINALFPELSKKQKFLILYYGRFIHKANLKLQH